MAQNGWKLGEGLETTNICRKCSFLLFQISIRKPLPFPSFPPWINPKRTLAHLCPFVGILKSGVESIHLRFEGAHVKLLGKLAGKFSPELSFIFRNDRFQPGKFQVWSLTHFPPPCSQHVNSQQLHCLDLRTLMWFLSWHGTIQGP